jgi:hypothetical protein
VVIWWWVESRGGGRRERWVRGVWEVDGKMMGCGDRDLNRSRESWLPRGRTIAQCWANVRPQVSVRVWVEDERSSTGTWRGSERSPSAGRTFASSVSTALLRALRRTIAQGWAFASSVCLALLRGLLRTIAQ